MQKSLTITNIEGREYKPPNMRNLLPWHIIIQTLSIAEDQTRFPNLQANPSLVVE